VSTYYGPRQTVVRYGPDVPADDELRLVGPVAGLRVLELGSGPRSSAVAFARQGAHTIVVEPSAERLSETRSLAEDHELKAEWHHGEMSDLAFLRGDSVDLAFSAGTVPEVADLGRLFRQVHRVLKPGGHFVFSYDHPAASLASGRSYFDTSPFTVEVNGVEVEHHPLSLADVFTLLARTGFRTEVLAEPPPVMGSTAYPSTVIWKARKEGV